MDAAPIAQLGGNDGVGEIESPSCPAEELVCDAFDRRKIGNLWQKMFDTIFDDKGSLTPSTIISSTRSSDRRGAKKPYLDAVMPAPRDVREPS